MAQHDYVIANANGATVRADINNALLAISSTNSGTSEPSTMYAFMLWVDTTNNLLKLRNAANNAWITLGLSVTASNTVDINGGAIDGTAIGASSATTGAFTTLTTTDNLSIGGSNKELRFYEGSNYVGFEAPALTGDQIWILPTADGSADQVLATNGSGTLSFATVSGTTINNNADNRVITGSGTANTLNGEANLTFDGSTLTVSGNVSVDSGTIKLDGNYPTGTGNVALGDTALDDGSLSGGSNVAIGSGALTANTSGASNTAVGQGALELNTTASNNTAVGREALTANTTGTYNVAVGTAALDANTTASNNTGVGYNSLGANTTAADNTAVGTSALAANITGVNNVAVGKDALLLNTGSYNTAVGKSALDAHTTGASNTAVGHAALGANTTAANNVGVGAVALGANTTGANNIGIGYYALGANTTGTINTAVGASALASNTTANGNTGLGRKALEANTSGANNTAVGADALLLNTTASYNTAVGVGAGGAITTGSQNTAVGLNAGDDITTGTGNICIGYGATTVTSDRLYSITMGRDVASAGNYYFTFGVDASVHRVYNNFTSNATWTRASDERLKKDIQTNTDCGLDFINDLRTVTYKFKAPSELDSNMTGYDASKTESLHKKKMYGFVAQEVKAVMDTHNITDFAGHNQLEDGDNLQGISYEMFVMPLVKAIQELSTKVEVLEKQLNNKE